MSGVLDLPDGSTWVIREGWTFEADPKPARCRSCKSRVLWLTSKAGKKAPFDNDGRSHFATCPESEKWRKPKVKASEACALCHVAASEGVGSWRWADPETGEIRTTELRLCDPCFRRVSHGLSFRRTPLTPAR